MFMCTFEVHEALGSMQLLTEGDHMIPGAGNDFQKDKQFRKLNAQKDMVEVTVVRGGNNKLVPNTDVVVGDVLVLATGDKVTAGKALRLHCYSINIKIITAS